MTILKHALLLLSRKKLFIELDIAFNYELSLDRYRNLQYSDHEFLDTLVGSDFEKRKGS